MTKNTKLSTNMKFKKKINLVTTKNYLKIIYKV